MREMLKAEIEIRMEMHLKLGMAAKRKGDTASLRDHKASHKALGLLLEWLKALPESSTHSPNTNAEPSA